jgi:hypothetical protein
MVNHAPAAVLEHEHVRRRQVRGVVVASLVADDDGRLSDDADDGRPDPELEQKEREARRSLRRPPPRSRYTPEQRAEVPF